MGAGEGPHSQPLSCERGEWDVGKYPPAKPGALGFEPLKAASLPTTPSTGRIGRLGGNLGAEQGLLAFPGPVAQTFSLVHPGSATLVCLAAHEEASTVGYSCKCQTSTATPAEPGELPLGVSQLFRQTSW